MRAIQKLLSTFPSRFLTGLALIVAGACLAFLLPVLGAPFLFVGAFLFTSLFDLERARGCDTQVTVACAHCNAQMPATALDVTHYIAPLIFPFAKVPIAHTYYLYCPACARRELEELSLAGLRIMAKGEKLTMLEIPKEEFLRIIK